MIFEIFVGIRASKLRTLVAMIGRMKINTFTFRVSSDRAPYRKSACIFESRFLIRALGAFSRSTLCLVEESEGELLGMRIPRLRELLANPKLDAFESGLLKVLIGAKTILLARKNLFQQTALQTLILSWVDPVGGQEDKTTRGQQASLAEALKHWRNVRHAHACVYQHPRSRRALELTVTF